MPTRHTRIAVVNDPALSKALDRARAHMPPGTKPATLVHALAIRGAEALEGESRRRAEARERLIVRSTASELPFEVELAMTRQAWQRDA